MFRGKFLGFLVSVTLTAMFLFLGIAVAQEHIEENWVIRPDGPRVQLRYRGGEQPRFIWPKPNGGEAYDPRKFGFWLMQFGDFTAGMKLNIFKKDILSFDVVKNQGWLEFGFNSTETAWGWMPPEDVTFTYWSPKPGVENPDPMDINDWVIKEYTTTPCWENMTQIWFVWFQSMDLLPEGHQVWYFTGDDQTPISAVINRQLDIDVAPIVGGQDETRIAFRLFTCFVDRPSTDTLVLTGKEVDPDGEVIRQVQHNIALTSIRGKMLLILPEDLEQAPDFRDISDLSTLEILMWEKWLKAEDIPGHADNGEDPGNGDPDNGDPDNGDPDNGESGNGNHHAVDPQGKTTTAWGKIKSQQ